MEDFEPFVSLWFVIHGKEFWNAIKKTAIRSITFIIIPIKKNFFAQNLKKRQIKEIFPNSHEIFTWYSYKKTSIKHILLTKEQVARYNLTRIC